MTDHEGPQTYIYGGPGGMSANYVDLERAGKDMNKVSALLEEVGSQFLAAQTVLEQAADAGYAYTERFQPEQSYNFTTYDIEKYYSLAGDINMNAGLISDYRERISALADTVFFTKQEYLHANDIVANNMALRPGGMDIPLSSTVNMSRRGASLSSLSIFSTKMGAKDHAWKDEVGDFAAQVVSGMFPRHVSPAPQIAFGLLDQKTGMFERRSDAQDPFFTFIALGAGLGLHALAKPLNPDAMRKSFRARLAVQRVEASPVRSASDIAQVAKNVPAKTTTMHKQVMYTKEGEKVSVIIVPGTQLGLPKLVGKQEARSQVSNVMLMAQQDSTAPASILYQEGLAKLVEPGEKIILAGHSQAGMITALSTLNDDVAARYDIQGVVTYGGPTGGIVTDENIPVMHIENSADFVPALDTARNPDGVNRLTVLGYVEDDAHNMGTYEQIARNAEQVGDESFDIMSAKIFGQLDGALVGPASSTTLSSSEALYQGPAAWFKVN
ncbi:alpha/beta hydrolase [Jonesia quinghaiensis]|uniref:alpha/beta hydrolase n=1 Tax=Jonesia quinghaiensis TaxID=262806 RepID=UPI00042920D7|nr:alpha/beta hydrolase [Jonesia quinghaiensis]